MNFNIVISGAAGDGIQSLCSILSSYFKHLGLNIFSHRDYMSRVRGGFNYTSIRISTKNISCHQQNIDYLIALNEKSTILFNYVKNPKNIIGYAPVDGEYINLADVIKETHNRKAYPMVCLGVLLKKLSIKQEKITKHFPSKWNKEIINNNIIAINYGYQKVNNEVKLPNENNNSYFIFSGNEAIAIGAMLSKIDFYSAYPMAPSTGIFNALVSHELDYPIILEQAEDEISAVMSCIGASSTGAKSMTSTSGGGLCLMTEAIGLSAIAEIPLLIVDVQRPGPATGLPTRYEQADLSFALNASQGEFGRIISAPRNIEDCIFTTIHMFNLITQYQLPGIILSDEYLADAKQTILKFDYNNIEIASYCNKSQNIERYSSNDYYYNYIDNNKCIMHDSHIHTSSGYISEEPTITKKLKHKLLNKEKLALNQMREPLYFGKDKPAILLICWGSTFGAVLETVEDLMKKNYSIGLLSFNDIYPLPTKKLLYYSKYSKKIISIEGNATGQFLKIINLYTSVNIDYSILKYDGRPFEKSYILNNLEGKIDE